MAVTTAEITEAAITPGERRHLEALERRIERGLQTFKEVGIALMEVRDSRLYREHFGTFEDYCRDRWSLDRVQAYRLIGAAEVVKFLGSPEELTNEAQARELVPILRDDPEQVKTIWKRVEESNEPITAPLIRRMAREVTEPTAPRVPQVSTLDRLLRVMAQATEIGERWAGSKPKKRDQAVVRAAMQKLEEALGV